MKSSAGEQPDESKGREEDRARILAAHIAEYEGLMNRCSYWMIMHFGIWAVIVAFLGLLLQAWNSVSHTVLLWGSAMVVQAFLLIWNVIVEEQYLAVWYLESELRPRVLALAGTSSV